MSHALRHDIAVQPTGLDDADSLMLDSVLERRRGHPLLLAVVAVELARRAGVGARLYSTPARCFAGFGEPVALVELSIDGAAMPSRDLVRPRCAHDVAWGVLCGLRHAYAADARRREADIAAELLRELDPQRP